MMENKKEKSRVPFHVLSKAVGASCNLACHYCYYPQEQHPTGLMKNDTLEIFIKNYIQQQPQYAQSINFIWQGGEPLLAGIEFYKRVIALQAKYKPKETTIVNSLQTNGTLITEDWARFFKKHDFIIGVSLDGNQTINDTYRVDKKGEGSHSNVIKGIKTLIQFKVGFNLLVVVHDEVVPEAKNIYRYLTNIGTRFIQFQPLTTEGKAVQRFSLSSKKWGEFLCNVYEEWKQSNHVGKVHILNIENSYAQYFSGFSPTCVHAKYCGNQLALETNGDLYACDHLIKEEFYLGNILKQSGLLSPLDTALQMSFGKNKSLRPECQTCSVKILCEGGCPTHLNENGKNSLCEGYYMFFSTILEEVKQFPRDRIGMSAWQNSLIKN